MVQTLVKCSGCGVMLRIERPPLLAKFECDRCARRPRRVECSPPALEMPYDPTDAYEVSPRYDSQIERDRGVFH